VKQPLRKVAAEASAKINIGWHVGPRRDDGYHDVSGVMQTITLRDRIEVIASDPDDDGPLVALEVPGHPELESSENLIVRAAHALAEDADATPVRIVLHKSIPVAAGLGGGSADAAATLMALGMAWKARGSLGDLAQIGATIGSDVPAILRGGLVHASGRGEQVRSIGSFTSGYVVLGVTRAPISAADAYAAFDRLGPLHAAAWHHNDLEAAACDLLPGLEARLAAMRDAAPVAFVSGSGPTVVGVVADEAEAISVAERVRGDFDDVLTARPSLWGVRLQLGS
jgi:4-diphosphocytidyl-2-C-methyl-D-erythritol kinase